MKQEDVFVIVSVDDKLPPKHAMYNCSTGRRDLFEELEFIDDDGDEPGFYDTHGNRVDVYYWLEKQDSAIVCTRIDLENAMNYAYSQGDDGVSVRGFDSNRDKYLKSKGINL